MKKIDSSERKNLFNISICNFLFVCVERLSFVLLGKLTVSFAMSTTKSCSLFSPSLSCKRIGRGKKKYGKEKYEIINNHKNQNKLRIGFVLFQTKIFCQWIL